METIYRIQVNIKDGTPSQWKTMITVFVDETSLNLTLGDLRREWDGILVFRKLKIEVME